VPRSKLVLTSDAPHYTGSKLKLRFVLVLFKAGIMCANGRERFKEPEIAKIRSFKIYLQYMAKLLSASAGVNLIRIP